MPSKSGIPLHLFLTFDPDHSKPELPLSSKLILKYFSTPDHDHYKT
jgi:hypothetical protein